MGDDIDELNEILWYHFQDGITGEDVDDAKEDINHHTEEVLKKAYLEISKYARQGTWRDDGVDYGRLVVPLAEVRHFLYRPAPKRNISK